MNASSAHPLGSSLPQVVRYSRTPVAKITAYLLELLQVLQYRHETGTVNK